MNLEQLTWLIEHGRGWLGDQRTSGAGLRPWQKAILDEQARLRHRSRDRFPDPTSWLWTDRSLQQASDWACARFKASLFPSGTQVVDACCGAGVDLVAIAQSHVAMGVDLDRAMLLLAKSNIGAHKFKADFLQAQLPAGLGDLSSAYLHIDPDRRQGAERDTRTTHGEAFSPALSDCIKLGETARGCIIKLAPATQVEPLSGWTSCWLGTARSCPQQLLVRGELTRNFPSGSNTAVLVSQGEPHLFAGSPRAHCERTDSTDQYIYDLHAALFASGLTAAFAVEHDLSALTHAGNYFTSDQLVQSPWLQSYRVQTEMSWDDRRVRKWLREHSAGLVEVKTRHVPLNANELQLRFSNPKNNSGQSFTLLLYQAGKSIRVVCASPT